MKKRTSKNTETPLSLSETILNQLSNDLISLNNKPLTQSLNGFILKDINDIYSFTDEHISIKLIFDQTYFNKYISTLPSFINEKTLSSKHLYSL
jgi:hypothetical protein